MNGPWACFLLVRLLSFRYLCTQLRCVSVANMTALRPL